MILSNHTSRDANLYAGLKGQGLLIQKIEFSTVYFL